MAKTRLTPDRYKHMPPAVITRNDMRGVYCKSTINKLTYSKLEIKSFQVFPFTCGRRPYFASNFKVLDQLGKYLIYFDKRELYNIGR